MIEAGIVEAFPPPGECHFVRSHGIRGEVCKGGDNDGAWLLIVWSDGATGQKSTKERNGKEETGVLTFSALHGVSGWWLSLQQAQVFV